MFPRRDPELLSQYLCRFCGERIWLDEIVRVLRVDPAPSPASLPASFCWISRPLFVFLHAPPRIGRSVPSLSFKERTDDRSGKGRTVAARGGGSAGAPRAGV
jgi:hypothetical protein